MNDPRLKKQVKHVNAGDAELKAAFKEVSGMEAGRVVLEWLMMELGYKAPMLAINPQTHEIIENSTIYNVSKRDVWLRVRQLIPMKYLNVIESERKPKNVDSKPVQPPKDDA